MTSLPARLTFRSQRRLWMWQASLCLAVAQRCRGWGMDQAAIDCKHAADELMKIANMRVPGVPRSTHLSPCKTNPEAR